ncbi:peptidoglycan DD-metalloendopeptidase family protein [Fusobacterium varium]|uniref:peptidoglycan DD-metalloendopeptidase family protein n=1 Tax=Fusobacterium varium TaxID=856 RepID=UPI001F2F8785|nr:peptidoglycan DD-metalloendopeptidase family protein [Fusobacterium varium]MCD7979998.1 peptidoglycan DD-metalloendopeptidase family protein [Fusobacterium sp.]MCF0170996.1 peptidoglycan DD-metalloendopeptidase family protein [Fusobacterium varium]MCF2671834.1 peptidoglycan DD-metalloendopeptidase family protein [Fusobacterium varium]UYI78673.1 MAG: peptidoglycan DD-metalloendopeptidase family protein [Fusobacterium varium]
MKKLLLFIFFTLTILSFASENIIFSDDKVNQGGFFYIEYPANKNYEITFKNSLIKIKSFKDNNKKIAFIPVHYSTPEGVYTVKISEGNNEIYSKTIKVLDGNFKKSYITVSKTMSEKRSEKNMKVMTNFVAEAKKNPTAKKLWVGNFILPVQSKISSPFGAMRFVNNKVVGYHSGIDFPVPVGTPLKASNSGKVVLAKELTSTGNTLVIDHGMNVFSSYAHMSSLNVKEGDTVKKGDLIGKSGNTGFTTGPHLHFTISIGTTFVNPYLFIDSSILEK